MKQVTAEAKPIGLTLLSLLAVFVGIITGFAAVFFTALIAGVHNLFYYGQFSLHYNTHLYAPVSPWGIGIILVPVIGSFIVMYQIVKFAPEARGHGAPEVMDAIFYNDGKIRPIVAVVKSLASALAIGTGASVGREGPMIQVGAALGSALGQVIRIETWQRITLVAAGAGAGIAATFNTPIGGVLFAVELMMPEVSVRTFLPVALATGTATYISRLFLGLRPAFDVPSNLFLTEQHAGLGILLLYVVLGALVGVASTAYIRGLDFVEDFSERVKNPYLRHAAGMFIVGVMMYAFMFWSGHYYIDGVGYSTIQNILLGGMSFVPFLLLLFAGKLVVTSLSLGTGSSGGIFSPALFMGATLGAAFGSVLHMIMPGAEISIAAFAMVGMAAMVGGATGAAMTAVTMTFEMTGDYDIVMPLIVAVAVAIGVRRVLSAENIYTIKLVARRHFIPKAMHANMFLIRQARDVMNKDFMLLPRDMEFDAVLQLSLIHI